MIDLHCHSTCSDGTFTPEELAEMGRDFSVFAVTDHDTLDGAGRFLAATHGQNGVRLAGVELSIDPGEGYSIFHLLGLGVDPNSPALKGFLDEILAGREERNRKMVARMAELGMPVEMEELRKYANGKIVARPHFARVMMDHGWVVDVKDAFERFLGKGKLVYQPRYCPSQAAAIAAVHAAGGVAVMAHPRLWTQDSKLLLEGLRRLKDMGLDGIEAVYEANLPAETVEHMLVARKLDLAVTAGSDFHGANKPTIHLGMSVENEMNFIAPLLAKLKCDGQSR